MSIGFSHEFLQTCPNDLLWSDPFSSFFTSPIFFFFFFFFFIIHYCPPRSTELHVGLEDEVFTHAMKRSKGPGRPTDAERAAPRLMKRNGRKRSIDLGATQLRKLGLRDTDWT